MLRVRILLRLTSVVSIRSISAILVNDWEPHLWAGLLCRSILTSQCYGGASTCSHRGILLLCACIFSSWACYFHLPERPQIPCFRKRGNYTFKLRFNIPASLWLHFRIEIPLSQGYRETESSAHISVPARKVYSVVSGLEGGTLG